MSTKMSDYDLFLVLYPSLKQKEKDEEIERIKNIISEHGKLGELDIWGQSKLAYPIEGYTEGYYILMPFKGGPEIAKELDRKLRVSDMVMRHFIVRKEKT